MLTNNTLGANVFIRITTLWAVFESFLGGLLHALHYPFTGLVLGFLASVCLTTLAINGYQRGQLIKSTLVVIAVKFMCAPHTPPMAYLAVFMQGAFAEAIFYSRLFVRVAAFSLPVFCIVYSGMQKLLVLTIFLGNNFWLSLNQFMVQIAKKFNYSQTSSYVYYVVVGYLGVHVTAGLVAGYFNIKLVHSFNKRSTLITPLPTAGKNGFIATTPKKSNKKKYIIVVGTILLLLAVQFLPALKNVLPKNAIILLLIRVFLVFIIWQFILLQVVQKLLQRWFRYFNKKNNGTIQQVIQLMPSFKQVLQQLWQQSAGRSYFTRLKFFILHIFNWVLYAP
jgi:hypothetical protein